MALDHLSDTVKNGAGSGEAVLAALEEHKEILIPAAVGLAGAIAVRKGPGVIRSLSGSVEDSVEETASSAGEKAAEGAKEQLGGSPAGKALSKATGGGEGGGKKTRRLPIQRWTDVAVPVEQAYEAWTKFEQYPKFMHRVLSVEQKGPDKISWQEKIWFSRRQWEGQITEQRKNDRIVWKTKDGPNHKGIVSFHKLGDNLTRVMVEMEFEPTGLIEKIGSGLRFVKRAVQSDLARFKAYVEMEDAKGISYREGGQEQDDQDKDGKDKKEDGDGQRSSPQRQRRASSQSSRGSSAGAGRKQRSKSSTGTRRRTGAKTS